MTTLALLKAEIADDLDRTDLTTQIASEIGKAIRHYQNERFYFNETREVTFATVADQKVYTSTDSTSIPKFIQFDQVNVEDTGIVDELDVISPTEWELLTADGNSTGKPTCYAYFNTSICLYPIPDAAYTIRLIGHIMKDAPTTDDEASNVWMTEAFDLVRTRVVSKLALRKIRDFELSGAAKTDEAEELERLKGESNIRVGTGYLTPTEF